MRRILLLSFFFQAEDGIRDIGVTGVQTCALPICPGEAVMFWSTMMHASKPHSAMDKEMRLGFAGRYVPTCVAVYPDTERSEERRVGEECRFRGAPYY